MEILSIRGTDLSGNLREKVAEGGVAFEEGKVYAVATTSYDASHRQEKLGRIASRRPGAMLRDLIVDYLREHGFEAG